jgi:tRNA pseudouridine55 synthase
MTGFIFLDKPGGITSFTAANKARKICGVKKAGHTGTLDPMATGILPLMLGGATRFSQYLPDHDKRYTAKILLGVQTDTLDITGNVISNCEVNIAPEQFVNAANKFVGVIEQYPPMFSAVSKNGVRLYKLARQGIEIEREAREVTIHSIDVLDKQPEKNEYVIDVACSAGTYIRSLAADIGSLLGCGAVLSELRRTQANGIGIDKAVTLELLEEAAANGTINELVVSVEDMLKCYPQIVVSEKQAVRFCNGGELDINRIKNIGECGLCRIHSPDNKFLGLGNIIRDENILAVEKILIDN